MIDVEDLQQRMASLGKRRGFFSPSYEIYGGLAGFYDYGPLGTALKDNILALMKRIYVVENGLLSIDTPVITPHEVFESSGHVSEFTDFLTMCKQCGSSYRGDHLLEGLVHNPDALGKKELADALKDTEVKCPSCGGELGEPHPFNLMFQTHIGPGAASRKGYLRPETAQGIFINFQYLLTLNRGKIPMGVFQVGKGFRNEISPRQGVIRVREFDMAEAEIFFHPDKKEWPGFDAYKDMPVNLLPAKGDTISTNFGDAVKNNLILNEALAYFMAITKRILISCGLDGERLRFRQHERDEMAHYAQDCWDAEALLSYGWVELVGIADRSAYDLKQHQKGSGREMTVLDPYDEPVEMEVTRVIPVMKKLGPLFGKNAKHISHLIETMDVNELTKPLKITFEGNSITIPDDAYEIKSGMETIMGKQYIPHVVEPSYGIGRIFYAIMEHCYGESDGYVTLKFPAEMAPVKVGVFPLMDRDGMGERADQISALLRELRYSTRMDNSGSIGRRYARMDEIGTPFCVTVDYDTLKDDTVTIRERDSKMQIRIHLDDLPDVLKGLFSFKTLDEYGEPLRPAGSSTDE